MTTVPKISHEIIRHLNDAHTALQDLGTIEGVETDDLERQVQELKDDVIRTYADWTYSYPEKYLEALEEGRE